jgi:tetratricopeptide (TPR) repeat protein
MARQGFAAHALAAGLLLGALASPAAAQDADAFFEFLMARRLEAAGDMEGALSALERAAEADPASAEVRAELAAFHLRRNDRDEAEAAGREALVLDADNAEAHRVLGLLTAAYADAASGTDASRARAFAEEAIDHLERAVATPAGATDIGLQYTLGRLYLRVDRANDAVDTLGAVVEENPGSVQARLTLAQAYASAGRLDDAIASLEAVVGQAPRVAATLGEYQEQAGRYLDAAESYTNALEQAPDNRELKFRRVAVLFNAGRYDDVATMAAVAAREHPGDSRFARMEVRGLFEGGSREAAYARMRALVAETPGDGSLRLGLADLYHDGDRTGDAERTLRDLVADEPANASALNYLGYLLAEEGRQLDEAIDLVRRALDLDPDNPAFLDSLGWAYFRQGDLDEAARYLEPAAAQMPDSAEVLDHLADLRLAQGRVAEAIDAWTQALDGDGSADTEAIQRKIDAARSERAIPQ